MAQLQRWENDRLFSTLTFPGLTNGQTAGTSV